MGVAFPKSHEHGLECLLDTGHQYDIWSRQPQNCGTNDDALPLPRVAGGGPVDAKTAPGSKGEPQPRADSDETKRSSPRKANSITENKDKIGKMRADGGKEERVSRPCPTISIPNSVQAIPVSSQKAPNSSSRGYNIRVGASSNSKSPDRGPPKHFTGAAMPCPQRLSPRNPQRNQSRTRQSGLAKRVPMLKTIAAGGSFKYKQQE